MILHPVSPLYRFSLLIVLSVALMIVDHKSNLLKVTRTATSVINISFEFVVTAPAMLAASLKRFYPDDSLHGELQALRQKQALLEARLLRFDAMARENERLSNLLSASRRASDEVLLTQVVSVGLEPFRHKLVVDRGVESGVYLGQPAISPQGVLGQVSETGYRRSVITLITDPGHGLPVQIQRNGLRTIILGSGATDVVNAPYLVSEADVVLGDLLVTSGMGGRFPEGYRVGEIISIVKDANTAFLQVQADASARPNRTRQVLLLRNADHASPGIADRNE